LQEEDSGQEEESGRNSEFSVLISGLASGKNAVKTPPQLVRVATPEPWAKETNRKRESDPTAFHNLDSVIRDVQAENSDAA
jgi:hypothetical protein